MRSFLERDLPQLGITIPAQALRRFWTMLAHYHGQIWNAAEPARSLGVAETTARRGRRLGVEVKRMDAPKLTPSMRIALEDLKLEQLVVLYPGPKEYALAERVRVVPLAKAAESSADELFPRPRRAKALKRT